MADDFDVSKYLQGISVGAPDSSFGSDGFNTDLFGSTSGKGFNDEGFNIDFLDALTSGDISKYSGSGFNDEGFNIDSLIQGLRSSKKDDKNAFQRLLGSFLGGGGGEDKSKINPLQALLGLGIASYGKDRGFFDPDVPVVGYQGKIPKYQAIQEQVTGRDDPNRRPGSGGRRYITDIKYVSTGRDLGEDTAVDSAAMTAAQGRQEQQAYDLLRRNLSNPAREERSKRVGGLPLMAGPMPAGPQGQPQDPVESGDRAGQLPPDQDGSFQEGGRVAKTNPFAKTAKEFFKTRGEERYFSGMMPEVRQATSEAKGASPEERAEIMQYMELELMREYFPDEYRQKGHDPRAYKVPTNPKPSGNDRKMAQGGITALKKGTYLNGNTDGMADKVPATIEGKQPAALSDGEFVIPADVVSHLGNGNSDAGAKILEQMMARVRKERTGNKEQGKEINARNMLPV